MALQRRDGKHPNTPKVDPVQHAEMVNDIWEMKREHMTFPQIAKELGISQTTAHKYFQEGLLAQAPAGAEEERMLLIRQIEGALSAAWADYHRAFEIPDKARMLMVLSKLMKDKRELMGLDAATKYTVRHTVRSQVDAEIEGLMDRFAAFEESLDMEQEIENADRAAAARVVRRPRRR